VLRKKLVADNPSERKYRRGLAATYANMGLALVIGGDAAAAHEIVQNAISLEQALEKEEPTSAYYRRLLAIAYTDDGVYRSELADKRGALESFRKSIAIYEELMAADPSNAQIYGDIGDPYRRAGDLLISDGDNTQALQYYRRSTQVYENAAAKAPDDLTVHLCVAICRAATGTIQARLGEQTAALVECQKAIALLSQILEEPANANHRSLKAQAYQYLGEAYTSLARSKDLPPAETAQQWSAARDIFRQSLRIYADMRSRGILSAPDARRLDQVVGEIAKCDAAWKDANRQ
jgi:tetratricopeptide (TPR) repeat protein